MRLTVRVGNEVGSNPAASIATEDISGTWRNSTMTVLCRLHKYIIKIASAVFLFWPKTYIFDGRLLEEELKCYKKLLSKVKQHI